MNLVGTLFRLLCSLLLLIVIAASINMPAQVAPDQYWQHFDFESIKNMFTSFNTVSIIACVIVVLAILRILEIAWNLAFSVAFLLFIFFGVYYIFGASVALPSPMDTNAAALAFCDLPRMYPVPSMLVIIIFALGFLSCSTAPFRIALSCILSYALWYGSTELIQYMVTIWAERPEPSMPTLLARIKALPWIVAAVPGAIFLSYALLMAFFESFVARSERAKAKRQQKEEEEAKTAIATNDERAEGLPTESEEEPAATSVEKVQPKPVTIIQPDVKVEKPQPQAEEQPQAEVKEEPKEITKPKEEPKPEAKVETKEEAKPEETPKPEAKEEPKPEVKEETKPEKTSDDAPQQTTQKAE